MIGHTPRSPGVSAKQALRCAILLAVTASLPAAFSHAAEFEVIDRLTVGGPTVLSGSATVVGAVGVGASSLDGGTLVIRSTSSTGTNPVLDVRNSAGNTVAAFLENGDSQFGAGVLKSTFPAVPSNTTYALRLSSGVRLATGCIEFSDGSLQCAASAGGVGVPTGAVMFFNLATCPSGWTALVAAQGRYLVGLPASGTLGGGVGTALSNLENRSVGQHDHASGTLTAGSGGPDVDWDGEPCCTKLGLIQKWIDVPHDQDAQGAHTHPITGTTGSSGAVGGTNAPYYQLLVCEKS